MAADPDLGLQGNAAPGRADRSARGDADLCLDEVDPRDHLGHRVLDLDARIDLDEITLTGFRVLQELDGPRVDVTDRAPDRERVSAERRAIRVVEKHRRRALHDLLVAPLHGAVALVEVHEVAVHVAEDLHLDMPRPPHELFQVHLVVAERRHRLAACGGQQLRELCLVVDDAHPAAATAPARLEHDRIADARGLPRRLAHITRQRRRGWHHRNACGRSDLTRGHLVPEATHDRGRRPDKGEPGRGAGLGERRVFRQKAVARMHRVRFGIARDPDDVFDVQIGLDRPLPLANRVALVRLHPMQREPVLLRVHRHRAYPELARGAHHADRDLAAVGDEQAPDRARLGHES